MAPFTLAIVAVLDLAHLASAPPMDRTDPWEPGSTFVTTPFIRPVIERVDPWTGERYIGGPDRSREGLAARIERDVSVVFPH